MNDEDVGIEHEQLLQTLYSFIESLAKRGNPQACWMISSTLQATRGNEKVFKFFMKMLNGIEEFLEPIMRLNHKNVGMVNELIHTYLSIYKQYCDLRILPFATGHHLLQQLYHFGKNEFVTSGAELSMAKSLIKVFLEMITIVINSQRSLEDLWA